MLEQEDVQRVVSFEHLGRKYWLKTVEVHETLGKRFKKGAPKTALEREAQSLIRMRAAGLPVPEVCVRDADYIVLSDCGKTLEELLVDDSNSQDKLCRVMTKAGQAMALLHSNGMVHGRAKPKDLCWDGDRISFIDLEAQATNGFSKPLARKELVNFVYYCYFRAIQVQRPIDDVMDAFAYSYKQHDKSGIWELCRSWARSRYFLELLCNPVARSRPPGRSPDFKAIAPLRRIFLKD